MAQKRSEPRDERGRGPRVGPAQRPPPHVGQAHAQPGVKPQAAVGDGPAEAGPRVIKDAVGNILADGDTVTVVRDLKIKGSSGVIKVGTKVRGIRLLDGVGDHDIDCKVDGVGPMQLKSSVVKKV